MTFLDWSGTPEPHMFSAARMRAIEGYSEIERILAMVFASMLHIPFGRADIIFYRLTNTSSRNRIITELLRKEFGDRYLHYWHGIPDTPNKRGLMNLISTLDGQRNQIVHWPVMLRSGMQGGPPPGPPFLTKPNIWDFDVDARK